MVHGVNGWHLANGNGRILATLDVAEFNRIITENLQRQHARNPNASCVSANQEELVEAVEERLRHLCNVPDEAKLVTVIHQKTMVFQS